MSRPCQLQRLFGNALCSIYRQGSLPAASGTRSMQLRQLTSPISPISPSRQVKAPVARCLAVPAMQATLASAPQLAEAKYAKEVEAACEAVRLASKLCRVSRAPARAQPRAPLAHLPRRHAPDASPLRARLARARAHALSAPSLTPCSGCSSSWGMLRKWTRTTTRPSRLQTMVRAPALAACRAGTHSIPPACWHPCGRARRPGMRPDS